MPQAIDYAALADQARSTAPPPSGKPVDYAALAEQARKGPDFQTTNEPPSASLWEQANTSPFHAQIQGAAHAIADFLSDPHLNEAEMNDRVSGLGTAHAMLRGGVAGMVEGVGNVAESFTTPIGIAMTLAGAGGESALVGKVPGLARLLNLPAVRVLRQVVQAGAGATFAGHGAQQVVTAPTLAGKAQGVVEMATGVLGTTGPLAEARAGWAAHRRTVNGPKSVMAFKQAAPPSKATPYTDEQFQRAVPFLDVEHAKAPIGSLADALAAADNQISEIEQHIAGAVRELPGVTIATRPLDAVRRTLAPSVRTDALTAGLAELQSLSLDQPLTLERADAIRLQLNAENKGIMRRNRYDVATARAVDPGFAAREAAARALRDGIYTALEAEGVRGIRQLRQDEGAVIAVRNAIDRQIFNGEKTVAGSAPTGLMRKTAAVGVRLAPLPAVISDPLARAIAPTNRTRDALMARAFSLRRPVFQSIAGTGAATAPPTTTPESGAPPPSGTSGPSGLPNGTPPAPSTPPAPAGLAGPTPRALGPAPKDRGEVVFSNTPVAAAPPMPVQAPEPPPEKPTARVVPFKQKQKPAAPVAETPKAKSAPTTPAPPRPVTPRDNMTPQDFAAFYEAASPAEQNLLQAGFEPSEILKRRGTPATRTPAPPLAATAKLKKPRAKVETPAVAAAKVVNRIERVIDVSGTTSGAEIQRRVIDALRREREPASQAAGYGSIEYRAGKAYGGREGVVLVDGEPLASVDRYGKMRWLDAPSAYTTADGKYVPAGKSTRPDIGFSARNETPTEHARFAKEAVATALQKDAGQIELHIPGDGTFTIARNPHAIDAVISRILAGGTSPWQGVGAVKSKPPKVGPKIPPPTW